MKWFAEVKTVEELRKRYRELLRKYHPDNENGSTEITQRINQEYDVLFAILSKEKELNETSTADKYEENESFKEVLNSIIHINAEIEIIGSWIWVHDGYVYRELLKSIGFSYAPKKKSWCWHFGDYKRCHKAEICLDDIRAKYGSQKLNNHCKQAVIS